MSTRVALPGIVAALSGASKVSLSLSLALVSLRLSPQLTGYLLDVSAGVRRQ
jgi:hypothetical protein